MVRDTFPVESENRNSCMLLLSILNVIKSMQAVIPDLTTSKESQEMETDYDDKADPVSPLYMCSPCCVQCTGVLHAVYSVHVFSMLCTVYMCSPCCVRCTCVLHAVYGVHVFSMLCTVYRCSPCCVQCTCVLHAVYSVHVFSMLCTIGVESRNFFGQS